VTGITDASQSHVSAFSFEDKIKGLNICKLSPNKISQKQVKFNICDENQGLLSKDTPSPAAPDFK